MAIPNEPHSLFMHHVMLLMNNESLACSNNQSLCYINSSTTLESYNMSKHPRVTRSTGPTTHSFLSKLHPIPLSYLRRSDKVDPYSLPFRGTKVSKCGASPQWNGHLHGEVGRLVASRYGQDLIIQLHLRLLLDYIGGE